MRLNLVIIVATIVGLTSASPAVIDRRSVSNRSQK